MDNIFLSVDCGTQSLRTILFNTEGVILEKVKIEYKPYFSPRAGWAEQDGELFWNSFVQGCRELKKISPVAFSAISAVGITAQRNTFINLDSEGKPLRPIISWLDNRKAPRHWKPGLFMKLAYAFIGMTETIAKVQCECKSNWIREYEPEIWNKTWKYLGLSTFLNYRLTSCLRDSVASSIGHIPINYKKLKWERKNGQNSNLFPIDRDKLWELVEPGEILGSVSGQASDKTGLQAGLPVVACGSDKGCETLGVGVLDESRASLSFGTMATVQTTSSRYYEPVRFMPAYPASIPGKFNPELTIFRGYWMIRWFKDEFGYEESEKARLTGQIPEEYLNSLLDEVPVGSLGLLVHPFWGPSLKKPFEKGSMIGFGGDHKKSHIYRAVLEGLGYALREGLEKIEKKSGKTVKKVMVSGGASQSDRICQLSADIFNRTMVRGKTYETSALGAAINMAVGTGIYQTYKDAVEHMVHYEEKEFEPNQENVAVYSRLYPIFLKINPLLNNIFNEIQAASGYPEKLSNQK
ncbi:MAG: FGGY-family carbohydrate kinase [Spirochaetaceae bacterium]|nr:FGGY-family carbohydrate kinase [Spirochaetaceae bacterium]